jgi:tetratricopeptide (TPR) repeat protein
VARLAPSQLARLLTLLGRGEHEEAARLAADDPLARLLRAHALASAGAFAEARSDCALALALAPTSALVHIAAGLLAYVTRDHDLALTRLITAAELDAQHAVPALQLAAERAARLGWSGDARTLLMRLITREPTRLAWRLELERLLAGAQLPDAALLQIRIATDLAPDRATLWMERATLAARVPETAPLAHRDDEVDALTDPLAHRDDEVDALTDPLTHRGDEVDALADPLTHRGDEVADAVARACALAGPTPPLAYILAGAAALTRVGRLDAADALLQLAPDDPESRLERAERALWRGDHHTARSLAEHSPELGRRRILGALAVLEGRFEEALEHLGQPNPPTDAEFGSDTAGLTGDYRLHLWRGEALLRLDRRPEAHRALTAASMGSDDFLPVAWVLRLLLALRDGQPIPGRDGELRGLLAAIAAATHEPVPQLGGDVATDTAILERTLQRLAGNRSTTPTVLVDGALLRLAPLAGERRAAREALQRIRGGSGPEALAALDAVVRRFPDHALPEAHRGELLLWLGRTAEARAALERALAIAPRTRWAYVGLATVALLERDPTAALAISAEGVRAMSGTTGPAVYMARGEALLQLDRLDEARDELERAVALSPGRLAAHIALALVHHAGAAPGRVLAPLHHRILARAPGLCSDAARSLGLALWQHRDRPPEPARMQAVLARALRMMQGNRSASQVTYLGPDGTLRFVASVDDDRPRRDAHSGDVDDLQRVRTLLLRTAATRSA